ncbi:MAG: hypothetical protein QXS68_03105 [Candidatus Methanomethylicaceae archaeon]
MFGTFIESKLNQTVQGRPIYDLETLLSDAIYDISNPERFVRAATGGGFIKGLIGVRSASVKEVR